MKLTSGEYLGLCRPARTTVNHAWSEGVTSENTEIVNYNIFVVRDYLGYIGLFVYILAITIKMITTNLLLNPRRTAFFHANIRQYISLYPHRWK